ncbi:MAG: hypothetical protein WDM96_18125 [Lacunisphaera sp.]
MTLKTTLPAWPHALCFVFLLTGFSALARGASADDVEMIVSPTPLQFEAVGEGVHGQLAVTPEIVSADTSGNLVFTITAEPLHGRVAWRAETTRISTRTRPVAPAISRTSSGGFRRDGLVHLHRAQ